MDASMSNPVTQRKVFERFLTEPEERQLFRYVQQFKSIYARRDLAAMLVLRHTGIRVGSLVLLTCGQAREALRGGALLLDSEQVKGGKPAQDGKPRRSRAYAVPCNSKARAALESLLRLVREQLGTQPSDDLKLLLRRGKQRFIGLSVRSMQARMQHWVHESGLQVDASPHWLRHTLAKRLMARSTSSDPQGIVQIALGHANRSATAIYTLPDRQELAQALEDAG